MQSIILHHYRLTKPLPAISHVLIKVITGASHLLSPFHSSAVTFYITRDANSCKSLLLILFHKQTLVFGNKSKHAFWKYGRRNIHSLSSTNRFHTQGWSLRHEIRSYNIRLHYILLKKKVGKKMTHSVHTEGTGGCAAGHLGVDG